MVTKEFADKYRKLNGHEKGKLLILRKFDFLN